MLLGNIHFFKASELSVLCMLFHVRACASFQSLTALGKQRVTTHVCRCFGSADLCSVDGSRCLPSLLLPRDLTMAHHPDLLTAPVITRPKTLSEFTKSELITEARARNLWFHESWTTTELRSLIQEDRKSPSGSHPADAGMSKMTVQQLKERTMELGYHLPGYATKGTIMRILRDQQGMGPNTILGFGRFKGKTFQETPESYRAWAVKEVASHDNPSEDLVMFANWWQGELHRWREAPGLRTSPSSSTSYMDPEENATIPYIEDTNSTASKSMATTLGPQAPRTPVRRRSADALETSAPRRMDQDIPDGVDDEVKYLEERLAVLKDRHGLPPGRN